MHPSRLLLVGALYAGVLPAQLTIGEANMSATTAAPSSLSNLPVGFDLMSDALALDQAFEHWWYFRVDGDAQESALRDVGGLVEGVTTGNTHADRDFADLDGRGLLKAGVDMDVYSSGSASGVLVSRMTLMNRSNAAIDVTVFGYVDVDIAGSFGNDTCLATVDNHQVSDATGIVIDIRGIGANASDVQDYPVLRNELSDTGVTALTAPMPVFAGDYTGAFEWSSVPLAPFEQRTFTVIMAVDTVAAVPPLVENYGWGNGSTLEIHANELPLQDIAMNRQFSVRLQGAVPFREYRMATSLNSWPAMPFIVGLDVWLQPASIVAVFGGFTDVNGEASETFIVPNIGYLTGLSVYHQGFYVDATAPNGYGYYTTGLHTRLGKL